MDFYASEGESQLNVHMSAVLAQLAELNEDDVLGYMKPLGDKHNTVKLAESILGAQRNTMGWRDYCHCYDLIAKEHRKDIVTYRSAVLRYVESIKAAPVYRAQVALCLYMAPRLIATGTKEPLWHAFKDGVWVPISPASVWNCAYNFIHDRRVAQRLGLGCPPTNGEVKGAVTLTLSRDGLAHAMLYVADFDLRRDGKDGVFAMPSACYDIRHGVIRPGLPSDLATMCSSVDVDYRAWLELRNDMLEVLAKWMSGNSVASTYLDIVAAAISEFAPRYAIVNYGTGSDGKSTWFHILSKVFGSYCAMLPGVGLGSNARSGNDATPLANLLVGKRICLTADANDVTRILQSADFKSMTGGDPFYLRGMYKEAEQQPRKLKQLAIINTNNPSMSTHQISTFTRVRLIYWSSKTVAKEDLAAIPAHQLGSSRVGESGYEHVFMKLYGSALLTELIMRHRAQRTGEQRIRICNKVQEWTKEMLKPKTILAFLDCCTEPLSSKEESEHVVIDLVGKDNNGTFLSALFAVYNTWRRSSGRMSSTDPTTIDAFKGHIEFYHPVTKMPLSASGRLDDYVAGVVLKAGFDMLNPHALRIGPAYYGTNTNAANNATYVKNLCDRFVSEDDA